MSALSLLIYDSGIAKEQQGTLYPLPVELWTPAQIAFYSQTSPGWSFCPQGYATFTQFDALGRKVVIPGLTLQNHQLKRKKYPNMPPVFTAATIENYLRTYLITAESIKKERDSELSNITHDLRAISKEIYHAATSARELLSPESSSELAFFIDNAINTQQLMSLRLDIIDYTTGASSKWTHEKISPYKKVDKVQRSFSGFAYSKNCRLLLEGHAWGHIYGPPIFEMVPIVLIENAIKYSPKNIPITLRFEEDQEQIIFRVESFGPQIRDNEKEKIFDHNFRGEAAEKARSSGSGIGLYAARTIMRTHFGGDIKVNQFEDRWIDGQRYWNTRFTVLMTRIIEDDSDFIKKGARR